MFIFLNLDSEESEQAQLSSLCSIGSSNTNSEVREMEGIINQLRELILHRLGPTAHKHNELVESLKFVGFAFGPFGGVEFEAYSGRAGGEDGAFDGGFVATLKLYFGK